MLFFKFTLHKMYWNISFEQASAYRKICSKWTGNSAAEENAFNISFFWIQVIHQGSFANLGDLQSGVFG